MKPACCSIDPDKHEATLIMEFLLHIEVKLTPDVSADKRAELLKQEHAYVRDMIAKGHLVRIWRTPGRFGNWSVWRAADGTQLHDVVSELPLFEWLDITVNPLATHVLDPAAGDSARS